MQQLFYKWAIRVMVLGLIGFGVVRQVYSPYPIYAAGLSTGDIAFVGYNADANDDFAIVVLTDIDGSGTPIDIIFTDNEWDGSSFNGGEGEMIWTINSFIATGTVVIFNDTSSSGTATVSVGSLSGSMVLSASDEAIFALTGSTASPTAFLAAITNDDFSAASASLANTGLTVGTTAIELDGVDADTDIAVYIGSRSGEANFADYLTLINNPTNWQTQDATGDQSSDSTAPDLPFASTAFTISGGSSPATSLTKTANPTSNVTANSLVTYTLVLSNGGIVNDTVILTDLLVAENDFVGWIEQPAGAVNNADQIEWTGIVTASETVTFTFVVTNTANSGTITNTAEFSGTVQSGMAEASYSAGVVAACTISGAVDTCIHEIQGSGTASPLDGNIVTIEGIVVGDFQDGFGTDGDLDGFFIQEEDSDADGSTLTSEGIFIFDGSTPTMNVAVGDKVQVTGTVDEFFGLTELTNVINVTVVTNGNPLPGITDISLPLAATVLNADGDLIGDLEQYEGMLVRFIDTLTVTELYQLDRFGEFKVAQGGRPIQFTQNNTPSVAGYNAHLTDVAARTLMVDDGRTTQNPDPIIYPDGALGPADSFRMRDTVTNLTGVIYFSRGSGINGDQTYRLMPTETPTFVSVNSRPSTPDSVGGALKVASLNLLNYFTTLDNSGSICGPSGTGDCRGAGTNSELSRQTEKLVTVLSTLDADVVGFMELENNYTDGAGSAIANLVNQLNTTVGAGTYAYVDPGVDVGDDVIAVGLIYKPASVSITSGTTIEILDDSDLAGLGLSGPRFNGVNSNRPPLAVTFEENGTGQRFTVVVTHLKSKNGTGSGANADAGDGAGPWNQRRLEGVQALKAWLDTDPTGSSDTDFLIVGDFNAYAEEAPITYLEGQGYTDLIQQFVGSSAYSYVFDGQLGTLDYALANTSLQAQVTGATEWHINADEPDAFDYDENFNPSALFDGSTPYRQSDHDPVLIGLTLNQQPNLSLSKTATPNTNLTVNALVTYTIKLTNTSPVSATNTSLTDTLPSEVDFAYWIEQPVGASVTSDQITWNGTVPISDVITIALAVTNTATSGSVTNTVEYSHASSTNSARAQYSTLTTVASDVYLPILSKRFAFGPDLVVDSLSVANDSITVAIRNAGNSTVSDAFWVDLYFNPSETPTINKTWPEISKNGLAWGVTQTLAPQETLILTLNSPYFDALQSNIPPIPGGSQTVYVLVDSVDRTTTVGAVTEVDETNNLATAIGPAAIGLDVSDPRISSGKIFGLEVLPAR